jgi:hypothetical protein
MNLIAGILINVVAGTLSVWEAGYFYTLDAHYKHSNASEHGSVALEWNPTAPGLNPHPETT